jgi:hypothetical protein
MPPPPEIRVFTLRQIARGPDEIRGSVGSFAFIYTNYPDPDGNRWLVQPGYVGHEQMTNTLGMLRAFFGPKAGEVAERVVLTGEVYSKDEQGNFAPTGEKNEIWDWRTIQLLARKENLFGRSGVLCGRQVIMLWGDPPGGRRGWSSFSGTWGSCEGTRRSSSWRIVGSTGRGIFSEHDKSPFFSVPRERRSILSDGL